MSRKGRKVGQNPSAVLPFASRGSALRWLFQRLSWLKFSEVGCTSVKFAVRKSLENPGRGDERISLKTGFGASDDGNE